GSLSPSPIWLWCQAVPPITARHTLPTRCSPSRWPSRVSTSTESKKGSLPTVSPPGSVSGPRWAAPSPARHTRSGGSRRGGRAPCSDPLGVGWVEEVVGRAGVGGGRWEEGPRAEGLRARGGAQRVPARQSAGEETAGVGENRHEGCDPQDAAEATHPALRAD